MSVAMQALYEGRREDAEAAAVEDELDIFEAAALGRHPRLAELLRGDESLALALVGRRLHRAALRVLLRPPRLHDHAARRRRAHRRAEPQRHGRAPDQRRRRRPAPVRPRPASSSPEAPTSTAARRAATPPSTRPGSATTKSSSTCSPSTAPRRGEVKGGRCGARRTLSPPVTIPRGHQIVNSRVRMA